MRIRLYSDLHLEFAPFEPPAMASDVVILAGDIHVGAQALPWIRAHFEQPVLYVLGNHEYYRQHMPSLTADLRAGLSEDRQITLLENRSVRIGDTEFFGCTFWTDFELFGNAMACQQVAAAMMSDYSLIRAGPDGHPLAPADTIEMHQASRAWLRAAVPASTAPRKVIITHHSPSPQSLSPALCREPVSAAYASNLEALVDELGADLWLHGHTHRSLDFTVGRTRIMANQRGYIPFEPAPGFDPYWLAEL